MKSTGDGTGDKYVGSDEVELIYNKMGHCGFDEKGRTGRALAQVWRTEVGYAAPTPSCQDS